jgi:hypothetical protein
VITHADRNKRQGRLSLASLIVSILALITSITGPFIAYYWLQGTLRLYELKRSAFSAEGIIEMGGEDCPGVPKTNTKTASYLLHLANSGGLPIEKVRVSIDRRFSLVKGRLKVIDPDPKVIKSLPPMSLEIRET